MYNRSFAFHVIFDSSEFCCKPFKGKQTMRNHQRQMHPEKMLASEKDADAALRFIKNLTCEICKITFAAPSVIPLIIQENLYLRFNYYFLITRAKPSTTQGNM